MTAQEHISKVARMLANQQADACGVDREDNWRLYGEEFIADTAEAMSSVLAHIDQQQAEIERLRSESEERLQNCAALLAEVERLRAAPATAPAQPEIVDLLAEMYELILANKVVLAEKSGGAARCNRLRAGSRVGGYQVQRHRPAARPPLGRDGIHRSARC